MKKTKDDWEENINVSNVIEAMRAGYHDFSFVRIPLFEMSPREYLAFAKDDIEDNSWTAPSKWTTS